MSGIQEQTPKGLWAYAYRITPPQPRDQLGTIRAILDDANLAAESGGRMWRGRVVLERRITHILIVSDRPGQHLATNQALEAELNRLKVKFVLTEPLATRDYPPAIARSPAASGSGRRPSFPPPNTDPE